MKKKISYGWTPSKLDGSEQQFDPIKNFDIPDEDRKSTRLNSSHRL